MKLQATVYVNVSDDQAKDVDSFEELRNYLSDAVTLELDTEEYGDSGVEALSIDWDSLEAVKE
jgi:hypothetical protein